MKIIRIIKLFLPPVVIKTWKALRYGARDGRIQHSLLPQIEHHSEKMIVIGNGPSLNESIVKYKDEIVKNDKIVTNFFASSDLFEQLKPNIYLFADPAFFSEQTMLKESIETMLSNLLKKTTWDMHVVVPSSAKNSAFVSRLNSNNKIVVDFYIDTDQNVGSMSRFEAWDKNLIAPPAQTVLNVALFLSLFWNYKETYIIGADSSFLEDLHVDQETNGLFSVDKHFYNNQRVYSEFDAKKGRPVLGWTLHDLIYAYGRMFECYHDLKEYADYKNVSIYNASEYSWINVFERKKLN